MKFAEVHQAELDNDFGPRVQPMRTLGRARPGLFVSYLSFQWFMRKRPDTTSRTSARTPRLERQASSERAVGFDCWSDGYGKEDCCDVQRHGPGGNLKCWDIVFTFAQCCGGD